MLRKLLIALAILIVIFVIADFAAKAYATSQLRDRAEHAVKGATSASASITSFPFSARLLLGGEVQKVHLTVGPVDASHVTFESVSLDLDDVRVDRNRLINHQQVQLTGLSSGTVTAELTDTEISRLAGTRVTFHPGRVTVSAAGVDVGATVQMTDGSMSFGGLRLPIKFRIPRGPLFPCDATNAVVKEGAVDVSCTINRVPAELAGVTVKA